jgi:uncharacterized protein (DUF2336 family)
VSNLSSAEFRHIENRTGSEKIDKLFRAAVSAFCALSRPSRAEIAQLDDLAMPLVGEVSRESRRFAAAALSECRLAPPLLARFLAGDAPDIAAPLLIRSQALRDVDLIVYIARCGIDHARIIARRPDLPKPIEDLLTALHDPEIARLRALARGVDPEVQAGGKEAAARDRLRTMMRPADKETLYHTLRDAALSGRSAFFQTRLADLLGLEFAMARLIVEAADPADLCIALRDLGLSGEQAFLLLSILDPGRFNNVPAIRLFLKGYEALDAESCRQQVRDWKIEALEAPRGEVPRSALP